MEASGSNGAEWRDKFEAGWGREPAAALPVGEPMICFFFPGGAVHWILHSTGLSLCASDAAVDDVPSVCTEVVTSCPFNTSTVVIVCLYVIATPPVAG